VITSDLAPMNDIAGWGALKVDPFDPVKIRIAIDKVVEDADLRNDMVAKGRVNIARFDAAKIAREYIELYDQMESNS